ncbi:hypothetical protein KFK09_018594 [Dendrobium nobile]|uniref:Uncharacterized protein n=1 Tax=Dendrobium nobile TaxID=94219 RepID=A0A8T3AXH2_DENNO|nr:hypothetical protein KFK09_018594 [Dendrobium nobile]
MNVSTVAEFQAASSASSLDVFTSVKFKIIDYASNSFSGGISADGKGIKDCISKACSILDVFADLNSSYSDCRSYEVDQGKVGSNSYWREPFVESQLVVKDDLPEPSLHGVGFGDPGIR